MRIPYFQVNAFVGPGLAGNPAGVCLLDEWLDDDLLQYIAAENGLSETAFVVPDGLLYQLRWMTPTVEVDLCGHATMASASVILDTVNPRLSQVAFETRSGRLVVERDGDGLAMDLPAWPADCVADPRLRAAVESALGVTAGDVRVAEDILVRVESEDVVRGVTPDLGRLADAGQRGVMVTAPGRDVDFVSRFFAPACGVDEDPVTGSAHCMLTPYWSAALGRDELRARQVSARGGELRCSMRGDRVIVAGRAERYLEGHILADAGFLG